MNALFFGELAALLFYIVNAEKIEFFHFAYTVGVVAAHSAVAYDDDIYFVHLFAPLCYLYYGFVRCRYALIVLYFDIYFNNEFFGENIRFLSR